jgi:hypothetical protein
MPSLRSSRTLVLAVLSLVAGCSDSTEPRVSSADIVQHRAEWASHHLTRYAYDYILGNGFFINFAGHTMHIVVIGGVVSSVRDVTAGQDMPGDLSGWPTIDALFDEAMTAQSANALTAIHFDRTYAFPTEMDLAGPPDASGAVFASNLQLLP